MDIHSLIHGMVIVYRYRDVDVDEMDNELYHHGVKGQKWGVRRYQNKDGSLTAEGKVHYSKLGKNYIDENLQKKVKTADTGEKYINAADVFMEDKDSPYKTALLKEHKNGMPNKTDLMHCNWDRYKSGKYAPERRKNCAKCSTAMDMMTRGYMIKAGTAKEGYTTKEIANWYKNAEVHRFENFTGKTADVFRNADCGILCMHTPICDHAIYYNRGTFYDGQIRMKFNSMESTMSYYRLNFNCWGDFIDLTHAEPNYKTMSKDEVIFLDTSRKKIKNG